MTTARSKDGRRHRGHAGLNMQPPDRYRCACDHVFFALNEPSGLSAAIRRLSRATGA
jgi:hypothetical protein